MTIDNFQLIRSLLKFENEDQFYYLQIIQRSKDNPKTGANNKMIKFYCIKSVKYFDKHEQEIKQICKLFNARAYIHLSKRSYKEVALIALQNLAERIKNKQTSNAYRSYSSSCGTSYIKKDKSWLLDIDEKIDNKAVNDILRYIEQECQPIGPKFKALIPTLNGWHLIVIPFNSENFNQKYPNISIHKNNPTLLYYTN